MPKRMPNGYFPPEFKKMVVETMWAEDLGYRETERKFHLTKMRAKHWETTYLFYGPEGFFVERRGRRPKGAVVETPKQMKYQAPVSKTGKRVRQSKNPPEGQQALPAYGRKTFLPRIWEVRPDTAPTPETAPEGQEVCAPSPAPET